MWGTALAGIMARPWARRAAGLGLIALAVTLFLFNLRRTAERAGRAAERLDMLERTHAIQTQMPHAAALAAAMILLTACAGVRSDTAPSACPPVVDFSRAEQARLADEVEALPEGALVVTWLADYAVLRTKAQSPI